MSLLSCIDPPRSPIVVILIQRYIWLMTGVGAPLPSQAFQSDPGDKRRAPSQDPGGQRGDQTQREGVCRLQRGLRRRERGGKGQNLHGDILISPRMNVQQCRR